MGTRKGGSVYKTKSLGWDVRGGWCYRCCAFGSNSIWPKIGNAYSSGKQADAINLMCSVIIKSLRTKLEENGRNEIIVIHSKLTKSSAKNRR